MPRCAAMVRRCALPALLLLMHQVAAQAPSSNATLVATPAPAHALFGNLIGLACKTRPDCGALPSLACVEGHCEYCLTDDDCSTPGKARRKCVVSTETESLSAVGVNSRGAPVPAAYCVEKDLFGPFTWHDVLATVLAVLSTALGSGCGVGGGGLLVPAFILVIGLDPKHAIPLSKATIFGNAVAIYWFNLHRKHPQRKNVPIIDYRIAAIMEPATLIGALFGVMMNIVFPDWLVLVLLMSLLGFITYNTYSKGKKIRAKENAAKSAAVRKVLTGRSGRTWSVYHRFDYRIAAQRWLSITRRNKKLRAKLAQDEADFTSLPPLRPYLQLATTTSEKPGALQLQNKADFGTFPTDSVGDEGSLSFLREQIERKDAVIFPVRYVLPLVLSWLIVLFQALLRGGHGAPSLIGVSCNSVGYWSLTLIPVLLLVFITWRIGYHLRLDNRLRVISEHKFLSSDVHWTWTRVTKFPIICITAGIAAGLLGVGGGMVKGPIMLAMDVLPPVQSATASYMILFTSSSTTLQFAIAGMFPGRLQYDYVLWFAFCGFCGAMLGQRVVGYLVRKYKRESIMVFILAITIGLSAVCMGYVGLSSVLKDIETHSNLGFQGLCGHH